LEHKSINIEFKATQEEGIFEGYSAYFDNVDSYGDVIRKGAFSKSINENLSEIKVMWNHDWKGVPIGIIEELKEDDKGLWFRAKLNNTATATDVKVAIKDGAVTKMSIGYSTTKSNKEKLDGKWIKSLTEIKLYEISPVNFPANTLASITGYKNEVNENELMELLRKNVLDQSQYRKELDIKGLETSKSLYRLLEDKLIEQGEYKHKLSVSSVFINEFVFNNWDYTQGNEDDWFDKHYRQGYKIVDEDVELVGIATEVEGVMSFTDKKSDNEPKENDELSSKLSDILKKMEV